MTASGVGQARGLLVTEVTEEGLELLQGFGRLVATLVPPALHRTEGIPIIYDRRIPTLGQIKMALFHLVVSVRVVVVCIASQQYICTIFAALKIKNDPVDIARQLGTFPCGELQGLGYSGAIQVMGQSKIGSPKNI